MKNLNEMTVKELKEMAKEMKISNWWNLKKDVLIEKITAVQNMTDEEKQALEDQKAKEDAAMEIYKKDWRKYTARFNPIEFMEKFRSGKIVLDETPVETIETVETVEIVEQPAEKPETWEIEAKRNIKNAYDWNVGGYENSVSDGEMTQEEFDEWIKNTALNAIYQEAKETYYGFDSCGGKAPAAMKKANEKFCKEYIIELLKADGYEVEMPEIEIKKGHAPTAKRGQLLEFDGRSMNIVAWGKELGISANTLYGRIYKMGWSIEKAFTTPGRKSK